MTNQMLSSISVNQSLVVDYLMTFMPYVVKINCDQWKGEKKEMLSESERMFLGMFDVYITGARAVSTQLDYGYSLIRIVVLFSLWWIT